MSWGTTPYLLAEGGNEEEQAQNAVTAAVAAGEVHPGDLVVVLNGSGIYRGRVTDTVRIVQIP
jgi:pyruvate kinase